AALAEANAALSESESRYRMLADNATDVIYTCDLNGCYTYVSPSVELQRGFKPEELLGKPIANQLPEHERRTLQQRYTQLRGGDYQQGDEAYGTGSKIEFQ